MSRNNIVKTGSGFTTATAQASDFPLAWGHLLDYEILQSLYPIEREIAIFEYSRIAKVNTASTSVMMPTAMVIVTWLTG